MNYEQIFLLGPFGYFFELYTDLIFLFSHTSVSVAEAIYHHELTLQVKYSLF